MTKSFRSIIARLAIASICSAFMLTGVSTWASQYIVKFKEGANAKSVSTSLINSFVAVDHHDSARLAKIEITAKNPALVLAELIKDPSVEYVVEDFKIYALETQMEIAQLQEQWANNKVNVERAWQLAGNKGSRDIVLAVIDTGVDYNHPALKPNMIAGYDFRDNDDDPMDETSSRNPGHGTHCTGSLGATGEVNGGVVGISPHLSVMPLRFLGADGSGDLMAGIRSIDFAIENGAHIISASWGARVAESQARPLIEAVQRASDAGVIFVAAAANDGRNNDSTPMYPANARFANTITVAATDIDDKKASWSNYGMANVDLSAPGVDILSTLPNNKYGKFSGTSMATPLVAGLVALLKAQDPDLTGQQVNALMQKSATKIAIEVACECRVDAGAAMESLLESRPVVYPQAQTLKVGDSLNFGMLYAVGEVNYSSSNESLASVEQNTGKLTAKALGSVKVKAVDSRGIESQTMAIRIVDGTSQRPGGGGDCPFDPAMCDMLCGIMPDLPFCK